MAMSINTKNVLEDVLSQIEIGKEYTEDELKKFIGSRIHWDTFRKYMRIERVFNTQAQPYSLEEIVDLLNSCAGDDCYDCRWDFQIVDGKVYDMIREERYIVRGLRES